MRVWSMLFVLFALISSGARAQEWGVAKVSGDVTVGSDGVWRPLKADDALCVGEEIKLGKDGSLIIATDAAILVALPNTDFKCVGNPAGQGNFVNVMAGSIGIQALPDREPIEVKSRFLDAKAKGATFSVSADAKTTTLSVKSGVVSVRDLLRQKDSEASAGQTVKLGETSSAQSTNDSAAAKYQAQIDAALADRKKGAERTPSAAGTMDADEAAAVIKDAKKKLGLKKSKPDAKAMANAGKLAAEIAAGLDDDEPEDAAKKKLVPVPLLSFITDGDTSTLALISTVSVIVFSVIGMIISKAAGDIGFGVVLNTILLMVGALIGAFVRDEFFFTGFWYRFEPYPGIALVIFFSLLVIVGAMVAKYKYLERDVRTPAKAVARAVRPRVVFHDPSRAKRVS